MTIYAVNSKEPIAAWIPSLDTSGNGTTTLTALVGSANGTLTNMDAATDWVADTDAGGVRALDLDGANDYISFPSLAGATNWTYSFWCKPNSVTTPAYFSDFGNNNAAVIVGYQSGFWNIFGGSYPTGAANDSRMAATAGAWQHVVWVKSGSTLTGYVNGTQQVSVTIASGTYSPSGLVIGRSGGAADNLNCRFDDVRIFDSALNSTDVSYLYSSGTGRGRTTGGGGSAGGFSLIGGGGPIY